MTEKKNPPDRSYEEILSRWHDEQKKQLEESRAKLTQLLSTEPEITRFEVQYCGSGDQGQVEELTAYDGNNNPLQLHDSLHDAVEDLVYDLLGTHCPGWEINAGSSGLITIDAKTFQGTIDHNWNVTQSHEVQFEL
jgi:hypothetical protein